MRDDGKRGGAMPDGEGGRDSDLASPLDVAKKWVPLCAALIFAQTLGFTALIAWREISKGVAGVNELIIAVVLGTAPAVPLFVVYAILGVTVADLAIGGIMVTARYLTKKLIEPLDRKREEEVERRIERGRSEGVAQGMSQGAERERRAWTEWNSRRLEAEAGGLPFDEPPPVPARISTITFLPSFGSLGMSASFSALSARARRVSSSSISSRAISASSSSDSSRSMVRSPAVSESIARISRASRTTSLSCARSLASVSTRA